MPKTPVESRSSSPWDESTLADPHGQEDKAERVNAMFDAIAHSYDLNNRVHSLWRDQAWRRRAVQLAEIRQGRDTVVDVACGTGDLAFAFADASPKQVLGIDFVPRMVEIARTKGLARPTHEGDDRPSPEFLVGDAMDLLLPDASADVVSIAFGIRNVTDPAVAIHEFRRILRPGGRLVILEFSRPRNRLFRAFYEFYFHHIMPRTATWLSRDRSGAYRYLPRSVSTFISREAMATMLQNAGFEGIEAHPLTFGICMAYLARVPETA